MGAPANASDDSPVVLSTIAQGKSLVAMVVGVQSWMRSGVRWTLHGGPPLTASVADTDTVEVGVEMGVVRGGEEVGRMIGPEDKREIETETGTQEEREEEEVQGQGSLNDGCMTSLYLRGLTRKTRLRVIKLLVMHPPKTMKTLRRHGSHCREGDMCPSIELI
jgi:hypothetical protein